MEQEKPKYDPTKKYQWEPSSEFTFNGAEFGLILNTFRSILASQDYQLMQLVEKASEKMEFALIKGVENGTVKEMVEKEKPLN